MRNFLFLTLAVSAFAQNKSDWPLYNGDFAATRFSALTEVNKTNVAGLRRLCTYDTGENVAFQTGPIVVQGTMYFTTQATTYAINTADCSLKWKQTRPNSAGGLGVNRGIAFADGKLFRGTGDAHVIGMDAATGATVWDTPIGDRDKGESVPLAPIAWKGMVFAGNAGGDNFGVTGRVYGLNAGDGKEVWHFNIAADSGAAGATWKNISKDNPATGGATWTSYSLDPDAGVLWVSSGNVAPDFLLALHPGDNLYTTSVIALDAKTGKLLRFVQPVKKDFHDWDMTAPPALIRTKAGRSIAAAAGKDGILYGIDRSAVSAGKSSDAQLKIHYATPVTTRENVNAPFTTTADTHFCPGVQGGVEWNGPGFSPQSNLLFVNAVDWCFSVKIADAGTVKGAPGKSWSGSGDAAHAFGTPDPKEKMGGWLTAVDADSGKVRWKYKSSLPMVAGVTPTAGGLVFTGELNGNVLALDGESGKVLWQDATGSAVAGGVITFEQNGHQRIGVAAGMRSPIWPVPQTTGRVMVYGLP